LADFNYNYAYRVPTFKEFIEKSLKADVQKHLNTYASEKLPPPPKELEELFKKGAMTV